MAPEYMSSTKTILSLSPTFITHLQPNIKIVYHSTSKYSERCSDFGLGLFYNVVTQ